MYLLSKSIKKLIKVLTVKNVPPQVPTDDPETPEPEPKYSVTKGRFKTSKTHGASSLNKKYPPFELCSLGTNLALRVKVVKLKVFNNNQLSLLVQLCQRTGSQSQKEESLSLLASYEVEKSDTSPAQLGNDYKQVIKDMGICESFEMLESDINSIHYYVIRYYHLGDWWCDVYTGDSFEHKDADLCDDVLNDIAIVDENLSADKPSESDFSSSWSGCVGLPQLQVCDIPPNFSVKANPMCDSSGTSEIQYYIVTYIYGYSLGTYKVENMPGWDGLSDLCKLFRFKVDEHKQDKVSVQYFKNGEWRCQLFERAVDDGVVRFKKQMWWGPCLRFTTEGKKRPVNGRIFKAGSIFHKAGLVI